MAEQEGQNRNIPVAGSEVSTALTAGVEAFGEQAFDVKSSGEEASGERVPLGQGFGASASGKHLLSEGIEGKLPIALLLLSFLMALAILFYVLLSTTDVLYSDYIRLVNSYLGKPLQLGDLLQKDILTRIPLTYFFREINRYSFGYTLIFDRVLGVLGLFLASKPLLLFMRKKQLPFLQQLLFLILFYSLNKWEMLLNGSGYMLWIRPSARKAPCLFYRFIRHLFYWWQAPTAWRYSFPALLCSSSWLWGRSFGISRGRFFSLFPTDFAFFYIFSAITMRCMNMPGQKAFP